jgi:hypothetical protein
MREATHLTGGFDPETMDDIFGRNAHALDALQQRQARDIVLVEFGN